MGLGLGVGLGLVLVLVLVLGLSELKLLLLVLAPAILGWVLDPFQCERLTGPLPASIPASLMSPSLLKPRIWMISSAFFIVCRALLHGALGLSSLK